MLKDLDTQPSLFITLEVQDYLIYDKLEQRRFDPVTKKYHYVLNEHLTDDAILGRLIHKPEDQHPQIKKKLLEYRAIKQLIDSEYSNQLVRISAEQDKDSIYKNMVQAVEYIM